MVSPHLRAGPLNGVASRLFASLLFVFRPSFTRFSMSFATLCLCELLYISASERLHGLSRDGGSCFFFADFRGWSIVRLGGGRFQAQLDGFGHALVFLLLQGEP